MHDNLRVALDSHLRLQKEIRHEEGSPLAYRASKVVAAITECLVIPSYGTS